MISRLIQSRPKHVQPRLKAGWNSLFRTFSSSYACKYDDELFVKVGGNGFVNIGVWKPRLSQHLKNDILIRLPPGPYTSSLELDGSLAIEEPFHRLPHATSFDIQFRLAPRETQALEDHRFPTAIHDVIAAFEYILEQHAHIYEKDKRICLYGSHIGGALALTLALTYPNQIHAVAVNEPLTDWAILDELIASSDLSKRRNITRTHNEWEGQAYAAKELIKLRTRLFRTPSGYFDEFASPTLFLRAPGRDTPLTKTAAPDSEDSSVFFEGSPIRYGDGERDVGVIEDDRHQDYGPYDDEWHAAETARIRNTEYRTNVEEDRQSTASTESSDTAVSSSSQQSSPPRRRKVLRRWPPNAHPDTVLLPQVNVFLPLPHADNEQNPNAGHKEEDIDISPVTRLQGTEMVELMRRACFFGRDSAFAAERVTLTMQDVSLSSELRQKAVLAWLQARFDEH